MLARRSEEEEGAGWSFRTGPTIETLPSTIVEFASFLSFFHGLFYPLAQFYLNFPGSKALECRSVSLFLSRLESDSSLTRRKGWHLDEQVEAGKSRKIRKNKHNHPSMSKGGVGLGVEFVGIENGTEKR